MNADPPVLTLMTRQEARKLEEEINELQDEEMYDTLEQEWFTVVSSEIIRGKMDPSVYYLCIELHSLDGEQTVNVPYDYFREHIRINKLG